MSHSRELVNTWWGAVRAKGEAAVHRPVTPRCPARVCVCDSAHHVTAVVHSGPSLHVRLQQM